LLAGPGKLTISCPFGPSKETILTEVGHARYGELGRLGLPSVRREVWSAALTTPPDMHTAQLIQIVGALLNMGAFALLHFEIAPSSALRYLIPNWLGSVLLVMSAYVDRQWGFLMLEAAWVVVTGYAIAARVSGRQSRTTPH